MASDSAERIMQAATRLFGERGYPSTSMRDIGEAVGLLAGSLYSHISSKEAVLFTIVEAALDRYLEGIQPIATSAGPADARLREAVKTHVRLVAGNVEETLVALHQWKFLSEENRQRVVAKRKAGAELFARILGDGIDSGAFKPVADTNIVVAGIMGTLNWVPEWFSPHGPLSPDEVGDMLADLLLGGLALGAGAGSRAVRRAG